MSKKIRIAVDAMGGDHAPESQVLGGIQAAKEMFDKIDVILVGDEIKIKEILKSQKCSLENLHIVNAKEVITMEDSPSDAFKLKPDSSLTVALNLQVDNKADALISAGNTGAVLSASTLILGRIKGVSRPSIGSLFPTDAGKTIVFDVGATVDCRPNHLLEFALMGSIYMSYIFNISNPRVGLLSVGEEKSKGNELTLEAYKLLENSGLNFIGNVEGRDVLRGNAEVIVCDGFIGNIVLKFAESVLDVLKAKFKQYADKGLWNKIKVGLSYGTLKDVIKDFDYQSYGGVPLLGVNGVAIIGHGK
ncbi:MAG: phosphate acyltransferase PlsX, partial [Ignavibacteriae bacterium]|nr:phosphate acyltransferase PlsX [Ignavibacteriota bacterium]